MDTPENYYAILGVPIQADSDTIKRAYRQLARRFHPDLAGEEGAIEMKRINRAYTVLSDPEKRRQYDIVMGGVLDFRARGSGFTRPRPQPRRFEEAEDLEFSGLNIFSTHGPFQAGPVIHSALGVISALSSVRAVHGLLIAAGSLDGKAETWLVVNGEARLARSFASDHNNSPVEALRELRLSSAGTLLAGWNRLCLNVWDTYTGELLASYPLRQRAVSAHYSLDMALQVSAEGKRVVYMALPYLAEDARAPGAWGVRGTDIISHDLQAIPARLAEPLTCIEEKLENRRFWAIRMRALAQDMRTLVTLSCAQVPQEAQHMAIVRRWDLTHKTRLGGQPQPQVVSAILVGRCADCAPPYAATPDASTLAFVHAGHKIRLCDTRSGTYSEFASGTMGGSSRLAISPDGQWLAVAREDSEVNEGVVDLWSVATGQIAQKFYHPWQVSALHFTEKQLLIALTDGTIQIWQ